MDLYGAGLLFKAQWRFFSSEMLKLVRERASLNSFKPQLNCEDIINI
jgi:hypothetical protein